MTDIERKLIEAARCGRKATMTTTQTLPKTKTTKTTKAPKADLKKQIAALTKERDELRRLYRQSLKRDQKLIASAVQAVNGKADPPPKTDMRLSELLVGVLQASGSKELGMEAVAVLYKQHTGRNLEDDANHVLEHDARTGERYRFQHERAYYFHTIGKAVSAAGIKYAATR